MQDTEQTRLDEICSRLISCGFKEYSARIYTILSFVGMAKVTELHALTKIPRSKIYETLTELEEDGFVVKFGINPVNYVALDGTSAHLAIMERNRKRCDRLQKSLQDLRDLTHTSAYGGSSQFHTRQAISTQINFRMDRAKRDVLIVCNDAQTLAGYADIIVKTSKRIPVYPVTDDDSVAAACPIKCYTTDDLLQRDLMHITYYTGEENIPFLLYFYFDRISTLGILNSKRESFAISTESDVYTDFVVKNFMRSITVYPVPARESFI